MDGVLLVITASLATIVCVQLMIPLAVRVGFLDVANGHKNHEGEIPPVGGLAMYVSLCLVQLIWFSLSQDAFLSFGVMSAAGLLVVIGALDDRFALPIHLRFVVQTLAILIIAVSQGTVLDNLGRLVASSVLELQLLALPVTVLVGVGAINAMNFVDGMDGLAGGLATASMLLIAVMAMIGGCTSEVLVCLAMLGCVAGFLVFNLRCCGRSQAKAFMGDAGSMFLGFMFASLLISLSQGPQPVIPPALALWLFGVPLLNAFGVIAVRLSAGKSPFKADRLHVHHICLDAGYTVNQALIVIVGVHILIGMVGLVAFAANVPEYAMFYGFCIVVGLYTLIFRNPEYLRCHLVYLHQVLFGDARAKCRAGNCKALRVFQAPTFAWSRIVRQDKHSSTNRRDSLPLRSCPSETAD